MRISLLLALLLLTGFLLAYRFIGVGGRILRINADPAKGFSAEYFLFLPDTLKSSNETFLLVEPNNSGFVDDRHKAHRDAAHDIIRFGQANRLAQKLGVPLLVPAFDRPKTNWETYTHALDRDSLLISEGTLARLDEQLLAMAADARNVLAERQIQTADKMLLNGFSASGSFVNRFTALHPESVAGVAAGGLNSMVILPLEQEGNQALIYPVGVADLAALTGEAFRPQAFAAVPQYYYMGETDTNDALAYDDAYSDPERALVKAVLGAEMAMRWQNCAKVYEGQGVRAQFHTVPKTGHETTEEINQTLVAFFTQVIATYR